MAGMLVVAGVGAVMSGHMRSWRVLAVGMGVLAVSVMVVLMTVAVIMVMHGHRISSFVRTAFTCD
jgi:hypothetical protein